MRPRTRAALHPEEASSLGAPVLVRRRTTPRWEGVRASLGAARVAAELITPRAQRPYGEVVDVLPAPGPAALLEPDCADRDRPC